MPAIVGAHILVFSKDPVADRAFFGDVLAFASVEAGPGWLIFALPPAELGVHPSEGLQSGKGKETPGAELYLMCDDLKGTVESLAARGVVCTEVSVETWGIRTAIRLPSGGELGLYEPTHPTAILPGSNP
jgi:hypothetical protein